MLPNFIGIGAPKAGTTWLFRCLQEHPKVFVAAVKETNFFDYYTEDIAGRMGEYEAHFAGSEGAMAIGEVSTRYLNSRWGAPKRIRRLLPNVRLFVSLRNPIDQVYSHYWHLRRQNFHQGTCLKSPSSFEEAFEIYGERLLGDAFYYQHIQRWLHLFDQSQLLIIFYDDILTQPQKVLHTLYTYLGVDNTFTPPSISHTGLSVRLGTSPRSAFLGRIHSYLYGQLNGHIYHPLKQLVGVRSAIQIKDTLRIREIMELFFQRKGYPPMNPDTRVFLRNRFAEDIHNLEGLIGRDLSHWK
jgi:hypothetical protein